MEHTPPVARLASEVAAARAAITASHLFGDLLGPRAKCDRNYSSTPRRFSSSALGQ